MSQFDDFSRRLEQHANLGIGKLCESVFRPKLKGSVEEFLEIAHCLTDEQLTEFELSDPFMAQFIVQLDRLVAQFESLLVRDNYQVESAYNITPFSGNCLVFRNYNVRNSL